MRSHDRTRVCLVILTVVVVYLLYHHYRHDLSRSSKQPTHRRGRSTQMRDADHPFIFIGGMPGSGTTLLRVMMDVHPDIRCGDESRIIPYVLGMRYEKWEKPTGELMKLEAVGVTDHVIDAAMAAFIVEIIKGSVEPAPRLCNKDPLTLNDADYLSQIFPRSKFILMLRDGRAVCHSIISRGITITGFNTGNYRDCLARWSRNTEYLDLKCRMAGRDRCKMVKYEELVQHPESWMRTILNFLDVPWDEAVLKHSLFVRNNEVDFSSSDRKTEQLQRPINTRSMVTWVDHVPNDVKQDMGSIAPALKKYGYDPWANPPSYNYDRSEL